MECLVDRFLGGGAQGEVYRASLGGAPVALKWYFPHYLTGDPGLAERLKTTIQTGPPNDRFLWPLELASHKKDSTFGYVMPLREPRFKGIIDLLKRRVDHDFWALTTACMELADGFWQLHSKGLCYRDINFGNVFFDPGSGEIRICDNDNVDKNGKPGPIGGTPRFMAPEIVRGDASPTAETDLFSLSVLLFYMLMLHHPLEGRREFEIHAFDLPAMRKIYGTEPIFIYDPDDDSNRPVPGDQENAIIYWAIYPALLRDLFTRAFTDGIRDPQHGRVRETEWRSVLSQLRDAIIYCACSRENFYDPDRLKHPTQYICWSCKKELKLPPRMCVDRNVVMLNHDTKLFPHHLDSSKAYDFGSPAAKVLQHPKDPGVWGLNNLTKENWVITASDGSIHDVGPGKSVSLTSGIKINFGNRQGEIRL